MEEILVDESNYTDEDLAEALKLLNAKKVRKAKIDRGEIKGDKKWSDMTPEEKEKANIYNRKRSIYVRLMLEKAKEFDIDVSDEEVQAEYDKKYSHN
jgi:hypothetical protein